MKIVMSKALLQRHAAKALREREDCLQKQRVDQEQLRAVQQRALQAQLDHGAQTIIQVNRENAALREEVDKLIIELNDYDNARALEESIAKVEEAVSPILPAYADLSPQHGFEDYTDVSITGECKE